VATATLTETLDTMWTSTWPDFRPEVIDTIFLKKYPFYFWLSQKGHIQYYSGGRDIRYPLEVDVNATVEEIGKTGTVDLQDTDPLTTVIYETGTIAGNINRYRDDDLANSGSEAIFKIMDIKRKNLTKSMQKKHEELLFRTRGSRPSYGLYGLLDLVDVAPTGSRTIGNLNQSTYSWWRNVTRTSQGVAATYLRKDMQLTYYDLEDVESKPDVIVCHRNAYQVYEDDLLEMTTIVNKKLADASYDNLVFKGTPMIKSPSCPSTNLYMLNSDYLYLIIHRNMNFEMTQWKEPENQPFNRHAQVVVKEQFISTHRGAQAVLHTLTY